MLADHQRWSSVDTRPRDAICIVSSSQSGNNGAKRFFDSRIEAVVPDHVQRALGEPALLLKDMIEVLMKDKFRY